MHDQFFDQLRMDHNEVKKTLNQMCEARSAEAKASAGRQLEKLLIPHLRAEEVVFYPALKEKRQSRDLALRAAEEHHVTQLVFSELLGLRAESENWIAKAEVLRELVNHHIQEEEAEVFKVAREMISHERMESMLADFAEEKIWHLSRMTGEL